MQIPSGWLLSLLGAAPISGRIIEVGTSMLFDVFISSFSGLHMDQGISQAYGRCEPEARSNSSILRDVHSASLPRYTCVLQDSFMLAGWLSLLN